MLTTQRTARKLDRAWDSNSRRYNFSLIFRVFTSLEMCHNPVFGNWTGRGIAILADLIFFFIFCVFNCLEMCHNPVFGVVKHNYA